MARLVNRFGCALRRSLSHNAAGLKLQNAAGLIFQYAAELNFSNAALGCDVLAWPSWHGAVAAAGRSGGPPTRRSVEDSGGRTSCDGAASSVVPATGFAVPAGSPSPECSAVPPASSASPAAGSAVSAAPGSGVPLLMWKQRENSVSAGWRHDLFFGRNFHAASTDRWAEGMQPFVEGGSCNVKVKDERGLDDEKQQRGGGVGNFNSTASGVPLSNVSARCLEGVGGFARGESAADVLDSLVGENEWCTGSVPHVEKTVSSEEDKVVLETLEKTIRSRKEGRKKGRKEGRTMKGSSGVEKKGMVSTEGGDLSWGEVEVLATPHNTVLQGVEAEEAGSEDVPPMVDKAVVLRNIGMLRPFGFSQKQIVGMAKSKNLYVLLTEPGELIAAALQNLQSLGIHTPHVYVFHLCLKFDVDTAIRPKWEFLETTFGRRYAEDMVAREPNVLSFSVNTMEQNLEILTMELHSRDKALTVATCAPRLLSIVSARLNMMLDLARRECGLTDDQIIKSLSKKVRVYSFADFPRTVQVVRDHLGSSALKSIAMKTLYWLSSPPADISDRLRILEVLPLGKDALSSAVVGNPDLLHASTKFLRRNVEFIASIDGTVTWDEALAMLKECPGLLRIDWHSKVVPCLIFLRDECCIQPRDLPLTTSIFNRSLARALKPRCLHLKRLGWRITGRKRRTISRECKGRSEKQRGGGSVVGFERREGVGGGWGGEGGRGTEQSLSSLGPCIALTSVLRMKASEFEKMYGRPT